MRATAGVVLWVLVSIPVAIALAVVIRTATVTITDSIEAHLARSATTVGRRRLRRAVVLGVVVATTGAAVTLVPGVVGDVPQRFVAAAVRRVFPGPAGDGDAPDAPRRSVVAIGGLDDRVPRHQRSTPLVAAPPQAVPLVVTAPRPAPRAALVAGPPDDLPSRVAPVAAAVVATVPEPAVLVEAVDERVRGRERVKVAHVRRDERRAARARR